MRKPRLSGLTHKCYTTNIMIVIIITFSKKIVKPKIARANEKKKGIIIFFLLYLHKITYGEFKC